MWLNHSNDRAPYLNIQEKHDILVICCTALGISEHQEDMPFFHSLYDWLMTGKPMEGIMILEVSQFDYVSFI